MPIEVTCTCGVRLRTGDSAAGKLVKCPKCGALVPVPKAAPDLPPPPPQEEIRIDDSPAPSDTKRCPYCSETIQAAAILCKFCKQRLGAPPGASRRCPECRHLNPGGVMTCEGCGAPLVAGGQFGMPRTRPRDLKMEAHLRAIAIWYRIGAILGVLVCLLVGLAGFAGMSMGGGRGRSGEMAAGAGAFLCIAIVGGGICALFYLLGHHLAKYSNTARIIAGILTILNILGSVCNVFSLMAQAGGMGGMRPERDAPPMALMAVIVLFGLAYGIAQCWALFNGRAGAICTPEYQNLVAQTPSQQPPTYASPFFWLPFVFVLGGCLLGALGAAANMH